MAEHPEEKRREAARLVHSGLSAREVGRRLEMSADAVLRAKGKYPPGGNVATPTLPEPAPEAGGVALPEPRLPRGLDPLDCPEPGWWLALGDLHIPMHDKRTVEAAVREARQKGVVGVLLNGDVLDMFDIGPFFREPTRERFVDEVNDGRQFLRWLRGQLPNARIVYKQGNHEYRLTRYVVSRAPALFDLPELQLDSLLGLRDLGIEWVADKRKVMLGKLPVLHGHEFKQSISNAVSPARLAFLRASSTVLVHHHHRTSHHPIRALDDKLIGTWSVGCACYLHPDYDPYNQWNHGYAMIEVQPDGWFSVQNRQVIDGRVV